MGMLGGVSEIDIDAPIEVVYKLVEDVEIAPEWQDALVRIEPLERDAQGRPTLCKSTADAKVKEVTSTIRFSYKENEEVRWEQVKGDLKSLVGYWKLSDLGDGRTHVEYSMVGDPGRMLGMLIRGPVEGRLNDILVKGRPGELAARIAQDA